MIRNRSIPVSTVMPVLVYDDVVEAAEWLCRAFGFRERLRIGTHRIQLLFGDGAVVLAERRTAEDGSVQRPPLPGEMSHSLLVRVEDADAHHGRAREQGARILRPPADQPYGERQYTAADLAGHVWTFSESIADVAPEEWGGTSVDLTG